MKPPNFSDQSASNHQPKPTEKVLSPRQAVLSSWKDIAVYLGKGVRTVQRWEQEYGLPVRRVKLSGSKTPIMALAIELDAWVHARDFRAGEDGTYESEIEQMRGLVAELKATIVELRRQLALGPQV